MGAPMSWHERRAYVPAVPFRYLLVRTSRRLSTCEDQIQALGRTIDDPELYRPSRKKQPWQNGLALRFADRRSVQELSEAYRHTLNSFDYWVMHDGGRAVAEKIASGLATLFVTETELDSRHNGIAQIFVSDRLDRRDGDDVADLIKGAFRDPSRTILHLDGGRVLWVRTNQPVVTLQRRLERFHDQTSFLSVCGRDDEAVNVRNGREDIWDAIG